MAHVGSTNRSASPNRSRSQSPTRRAANGSKVVKKVPWVNPSSNKHPVGNSPSEIHQRNSTSKAGLGSSSLRASFEHNENERDLNGSKMNRARSPAAAAPLKGAKNFMSPTISASSKVIAASPRRRVLSERNDGTRSSLSSLSDSFDFTEMLENDAKSETGTGSHVTVDAPKILKASPKKVDSNGAGFRPQENFYLQESLFSFPKVFEPAESSPSVSVTHCSPAVASLDEDPAPPSYDPKTNYLSPRPRFLHYKPKPRIEHYLIEGEGFSSPINGGQLEERFSSESSEVASEQGEEIQFSDDQTVCEDESCPSEEENGEIGKKEQAHDPEPKHDDAVMLEQTPKSHFFTGTKFMKFLLMVVVASLFVSVIDTPTQGEIYSLSSLKRESIMNLPTSALQILDEPYIRDSFVGLRDHASLKFGELASKFKDLSISSVARFQMLIASIVLPSEELGFYLNNNMTATEVEEVKDLTMDKLEQEEEQRLVPDSRDVQAEKSYSHDIVEITEAEVDSMEQEEEQRLLPVVLPSEELGFYLNNNTTATEVEEFKDLTMNQLEQEEEKRLVLDSRDAQTVKSHSRDNAEITEAEVDSMEQEEEQRLLPDSEYVEAENSCSDGFLETTETETAELGEEEEDFPVKPAIIGVTEDEILDFAEDRAHVDLGLKETEDEIMEEVQISPLPDHPNGEELRSYLALKPSYEEEEEPQAENILPQTNFEVHTDAQKGHGNSYLPQIFHNANFALGAEFPWQTLWGLFSIALAIAAISISLRVSHNKHMPSTAYYALSSPGSNVMSDPMGQKHMYLQNPSQSYLPEAETMMGESGPSEVSSSLQKSLSFGQRRARRGMDQQDAVSHERDLRRDSVASSSSYGSFTTYERLSAKKGGHRGDDEALTPVRRSSRIRSQLTSP